MVSSISESSDPKRRPRRRHGEPIAIVRAIRDGEVDAFVVNEPSGERVYTLGRGEPPYRLMIEAMDQGAALLTVSGEILYCNPRFASLLGIAPDALHAKSFMEFVAGDSQRLYDALLRRARWERTSGEIRLQRGDGAPVPTMVAFSQLSVGDVPVLCAVVTDLSAQHKADQVIAAESLWRSVLDQANDAILLCDPAGNVIRASRPAFDICGKNPLVEPFEASFPLRFADSEAGAVGSDHLCGHNVFCGREVFMVREDGRRFDLLLSCGPVRSADGVRRGTVITLVDITLQKKTERRLAEALERERAARIESDRANRVKDEFIATVSHELRNPLNSVVGWTHLIRQGKLDPASVEQGLEAIERGSLVQTQLLNDLLDVSRMMSGKLRIELERVNLVDMVRGAVAAARPSADAKSISLILEPYGGPLWVAGDAGRIQQIVGNLVGNAIKFTDSGGCVEVSLGKGDGCAEIRVRDNGQGISPDFLPHIFERFRQDMTPSRANSGLGLGLSIVSQLVELHRGTIRAESDGLERGSTFTVCLPLID